MTFFPLPFQIPSHFTAFLLATKFFPVEEDRSLFEEVTSRGSRHSIFTAATYLYVLSRLLAYISLPRIGVPDDWAQVR